MPNSEVVHDHTGKVITRAGPAATSAAGTGPGASAAPVTVDPSTGQFVRTVTVREWKPLHSTETLPEIESTIDSWGNRRTLVRPVSPGYDNATVEQRVDRLTTGVDLYGTASASPPTASTHVTETVPQHKPGRKGILYKIGVRKGATEETVEAPAKPAKKFSWGFGKKGGTAEAEAEAYQPQCSALTEDGAQCRNSARDGSKYCAPHKGYQPPTAKGLAQRIEGEAWDPNDSLTDRQSVRTADTKPKVRRAKDTVLTVRRTNRSKRPATTKGGGKKR
jgi:hypothetical protein